jgi:hypothetical protein
MFLMQLIKRRAAFIIHAFWFLKHKWVLIMARESHISLALETVSSMRESNRSDRILFFSYHILYCCVKAMVLHQILDKILNFSSIKFFKILDDYLLRGFIDLLIKVNLYSFK